MTLEDVKKKIRFWTTEPTEPLYLVRRCASIRLLAEVSFSPHGPPPMSEIDERLAHSILTSLYADRRREIQEKLFEIRCANPFDGFGYRDKIDELEKLLSYGPPV